MCAPRAYQQVLRVLLAAVLAFSLRLTVLGAAPVDDGIKLTPVAGMPATAEHARLVATSIKATWAHMSEQSNEPPYGKVVVHLSVDRLGKVFDVRVVSGSSKRLLRRLALGAVNGTQLPSMSDDVIKELQGKRLPLDITFECVPLPSPVQKSSHH